MVDSPGRITLWGIEVFMAAADERSISAAAKRLGIPTVAIFQTDVAGFAGSYGLRPLERAAWWWTRQMHKQCDLTLAPSSASVSGSA